jgi:sigma-B regulation protein RsbU (phosphoserine phosphatase)
MITAAAKASCDTVRAMTNDTLTVTYLLEILNRAIYESAKRKFVMTCFASVIDPKTRTITYANAGHNFPYLYREVNGKGEFGILMTRGNRLGDMVESKYTAKQMDLQKGDILVKRVKTLERTMVGTRRQILTHRQMTDTPLAEILKSFDEFVPCFS